MKVTLFFCLLAVYGAVATLGASISADVEVDTSAAAAAISEAKETASSVIGSAVSATESLASKFSPGNLMENVVTAVDKGLSIKNEIVNQTSEIAKDAINAGVASAQLGIGGAADIFSKGLETAENIKTTVNDHAGKIVGKGINIANTLTLGKMSSALETANSAAQAGISAGNSAGTMGLNLINNVGSAGLGLASSITGKFGTIASAGINQAAKVDKSINDNISAGVSKAAGAASTAGKQFGSFISNAWTMPSKRVSLSASVSN